MATLQPNYPWAHVAGQQKCWTCRKKRVKCDGCLPTCFKCKKTGRQCLGYSKNKPLVWTGLARRGRLANRSFESDATTSAASTNLRPAPANQLSVRNMSEPAFRDLSARSREYLSYYIHRCCVECTLYGDDSQNRFKQFMVLLPDNPVLVHVIIALSAAHQAQAVSYGSGAGAASSASALVRRMSQNDLAATQRVDALAHLSLGMGALREAVANSDCSDALLATIFLLTWVDVIDSQGATWRLHLEGLKVLISLRRPSSPGAASKSLNTSNSPFQKWFEEVYVLLSVFGSTFDPYSLHLLDVLSRSELRDLLDRAEEHNWNGCPSEIGFIIHTFNTLGFGALQMPVEDISEIFDQLRDFDCESWTAKSPKPSSTRTRHHLAEAWKGAAEIYGRRALGGMYPCFADVPPELPEAVLFNLGQIPTNDTHFKAAVWPAFVVGAEAKTDEARQLISTIFEYLIDFLHLSVLHFAFAQLKHIWARSSPYTLDRSWIHEIWELKQGVLLM